MEIKVKISKEGDTVQFGYRDEEGYFYDPPISWFQTPEARTKWLPHMRQKMWFTESVERDLNKAILNRLKASCQVVVF